MRWLSLFVVAVIAAALARRRLVRWGASDDEIHRVLPGDDLVPSPHTVTNRAITIAARPEEIWPWLVQMGDAPRAGYYSYVPVERTLGMKVENSNRILPEFQHLELGDALDAGGSMRVRGIEENHYLILGPPELPHFDSTWASVLLPQADGTTRLVSRVRARYKRWTASNIVALLILDPGQLIMERKWLLGVKERAERSAAAARVANPASS